MRRLVSILPLIAVLTLAACKAPTPESKAPASPEASTPVAATAAEPAAAGPQTLEAFQARVAGGFDGLDANGDGVVSTEELNSASGGRAGPMLSRLDENADGQVTRTEMAAGAARMFKRMDANGDGVVTPDERPQVGGARP